MSEVIPVERLIQKQETIVFNFIHIPPWPDLRSNYLLTGLPFRVRVTNWVLQHKSPVDVEKILALYVQSGTLIHQGKGHAYFEVSISGVFKVEDGVTPSEWQGSRNLEIVIFKDRSRAGLFIVKGGNYSLIRS